MTIPSETNIHQAVSILQQGGILAYPTEAVFGLGCDPQRPDSIERLLQIKQRPADKGLILIASDIDQLENFIDETKISTEIWQQVISSWPGPVTWLLPAKTQVSRLLRGRHESIAVRVSAHPLVQRLCNAFGGAIVSTSANLSAQPPAVTASEVQAQFGNNVDFILDGQLGGAQKPTEIRDAVSGKIIRPAE